MPDPRVSDSTCAGFGTCGACGAQLKEGMSHGAVTGRKRFPKMLFCGTRTGKEAQPPEAGPAMRCAVVEDSLRAGDGPWMGRSFAVFYKDQRGNYLAVK